MTPVVAKLGAEVEARHRRHVAGPRHRPGGGECHCRPGPPVPRSRPSDSARPGEPCRRRATRRSRSRARAAPNAAERSSEGCGSRRCRWRESAAAGCPRAACRPGSRAATNRRQRHVARAVVGGVRQRSGAGPVLGGREGVEDAWHHAPALRARASKPSSVKGGTSTGRRIDSTELPACPWHRETVVEAAAAGAGRCDSQAVECRAAAFVGVEAVAHELAQEPPALRTAEPDHAAQRRRRLAQRRVWRRRTSGRTRDPAPPPAKSRDRRAVRGVHRPAQADAHRTVHHHHAAVAIA